MAPSTSPNNHWIHLNMEGDHLEVNTTISHVLNGMAPFNFDEKTKTESVGPLPGFFLFVCFAGVVVTAKVTLKKARAASTAGANEQNERKPLVPSAAVVQPVADHGFTYQEVQ